MSADAASKPYIRGILDKSKPLPGGSGARFKAVQVEDIDTEADERALRTLRRGSCCLVTSGEDTPFIGVVLEILLAEGEPRMMQLRVAWLYRQHEISADHGQQLHPNEVFISKYTNMVEAASVMHPCQIFFLPAKAVSRPGGLPLSAQGEGKMQHMRLRPGLICCRAWDAKKERLVPFPITSGPGRRRRRSEEEEGDEDVGEMARWLMAQTVEQLEALTADSRGSKRKR